MCSSSGGSCSLGTNIEEPAIGTGTKNLKMLIVFFLSGSPGKIYIAFYGTAPGA